MKNFREIATPEAPQALGPYSQALDTGRAPGLVFVSGAIPVDPRTGEVCRGGTAEQTERVLRNIEAVLRAAGLEMADVVKTTVYLSDLSAFEEMNETYGRFFSRPYPARATVEVAGLPKGVAVEIEAIAVRT